MLILFGKEPLGKGFGLVSIVSIMPIDYVVSIGLIVSIDSIVSSGSIDTQ